MAKQMIPKVTPYMISKLPDQTAEIINRIIDKLNNL